ncbi:MAG TPA: glycosyl hydrolase [Phycisphaerae bacterium]|nr:glycosyl hydrolase [Phycisphaerae bacterium]
MSLPEQLTETWRNPPAIYRGAPFWSWNSHLDPQRLCRAIESMHRAGMGGFFMHSRYGLKTPYLSEKWFECVSACVAKARELNMKAYLYDEDRWPSGTAGGAVTRENPAFGAHAMVLRSPGEPTDGAERVALFAVRLDGEGRLLSYEAVEQESAAEGGQVLAFDVVAHRPRAWHNDASYVDALNADAVAEFIRLTHRAYADRYSKDFGGVIPAIFTDEPYHGGITFTATSNVLVRIAWPYLPWTAELPRQFKKRRGYDLRDHLPELFYDLADGEFSKVKYDYHRTVTELFTESFSRQVGQWCQKHNIALTGHYLAEQTLHSQISVAGAAMPHYEHMQWPGIDLLCDQADELSTAKQCTSVADQLGRERVLSELYGCTGWDWPLEGHKFVGDWQLAVGVNFRCPHLTHYSLAGGAKRDYPASIFDHSPWWKHYGVVEDYFARLCFMLTQGKPVRDVLVIHPVESGWGVFGPGSGEADSPLGAMNESLSQIIRTLSCEHYDWDFGDESLLARHAKVSGAALKVGQMSYELVIVPPSITLRRSTVSVLGRLVAGGGKVIFAGRIAERVDAEPSGEVRELAARAITCGDRGDHLVPAVESAIPRRVSIAEDGAEQTCTWSMLRAVKGGQLLFVQSHDRREPHRVSVSVPGRRPVVMWDPQTGAQHRVKARANGNRVEFDLDLPPTGSALVSMGMSMTEAGRPYVEPTVVHVETISGPFQIELTEPNTLPLDYCTFRFAEEAESEPMPTLKADATIRKRFGLGDRLGRDQQPWYLYATGVVDTAPRGACRMRRAFHVTDLPGRCRLALEQPEDFRITVNGKPAGRPDGWWVDEDIKTIDITDLLVAGDNEIVADFDYRPDMELEDMYLVGDFGVARRGDGPAEPGGYTLVAPPARLHLGSWVGQGLDFYGAAVRYKLNVAKPPAGKRMRIVLPEAACTAAAVHVGGRTFVMPWAPFRADITDAMTEGANEVVVEVIGGRKNILGPLHTPWGRGTGPGQFDPENKQWTRQYHLVDHGLMSAVLAQTLET